MERTFPMVPGANAKPMHLTGVHTTNNCRTRANQRSLIRVRSSVRPTGGRVDLDMTRASGRKRPRKARKTADAWVPRKGTMWEAWA